MSAPGEYRFLRSGDLIFQQSARSRVEISIQEVTSSAGEYSFTHVGIVYADPSGELFVLEAAPPEVTLTPIEKYLHHVDCAAVGHMPAGNEPADHISAGDAAADCISVAGRLKPEFRHLIPDALACGMLLVGKRYDYDYDPDDDEYYCSELIYEIFRRANGGREVFARSSMTFKTPDTDSIADGWITYFEKLGVPVPEGKPGTNPGAMSRSEIIEILGTV